jgi:hypothetical protein
MKKLLKKLPGIRNIIQERDRLNRLVHRYEQFGKPGHFYSPLPSVAEIEQEADRIYGKPKRTIPGIELNESKQLELYEIFQSFYAELSFPDTPSPDFRYYYQNIAYSYSDAIILYCMLRHLQPKTVIEIGSGFSSALMLDTDERF